MSGGDRLEQRARRLHRLLLRAYPQRFRSRFQEGMTFAFVARSREARARGRLALAAFWARSTAQAAALGVVERLRDLPSLFGMAQGAFRELHRGSRRLLRSPGFTFATVATLALGIGATTAIWAVVHAVLVRPLPYPDAERLVSVAHSALGADVARIDTSYGALFHYRNRSRTLETIGSYLPIEVTLTERAAAPVRLRAALVDAAFFDVFTGSRLALGRPIRAEEDVPDASEVATISHGLWRQRYGADPGILGRTIEIDGRLVMVVGVMSEGFDVPSTSNDVWLARRLDTTNLRLGGFGIVTVGRVAPSNTPETVRAELERLIPTLNEPFPGPAYDMLVVSGKLAPLVDPLKERRVGGVQRMLWILLGTVGFVLAAAFANVANLFLVRGEGRRREIAIRTALGAGGARIAGTYLSESLLIAVAGGLLGTGLALIATRALVRFGPTSLPRLHEVTLSPAVLAAAAALTLVTTLAFGLLPALRRRPADLSAAIQDGGRTATGGRETQRMRQLLVVAQVSLALVLLVGAGLMVRSFWRLQRIDPGFTTDDAITFRVPLSRTDYPDARAAAAFHHRLRERLAALPGVAGAGAISCLPLDGCSSVNPVYVEGADIDPDRLPKAVELRGVTPGYLAAAGIPILEGRDLEDADLESSGAGVVSASLAARLWPGESAIGKRFTPDLPDEDATPYTVVGVAGDVRALRLTDDAPEVLYLTLAGDYPYITDPYSLSVVIKGRPSGQAGGHPGAMALVEAARAVVTELDPQVPVDAVRTLETLLESARAALAFTMILLAIAGGVALVLGLIGVYGVLAYMVAQRTGEIGIRMALGAQAAHVRRMVVGQGAALVAIGILIGLGVAAALSRSLAALLYDVEAADPLTFVAVSASLALVALLATWLPAVRAARVDPVEALRGQ